MKPRVLHIIPSLGQGGAERVLANLLDNQQDSADHHVLSLTDEKPFFDFKAHSIEMLGLARGSGPAHALQKVYPLRRHVNRIAPQLIHGWLYHGNLFSAAAVNPKRSILWSIHNTTLSANGSKPRTRGINRLCARFSRLVPRRILYCTEAARGVHEQMGYDPKRGVVIHNGIDLGAFKFDPAARARLRDELQLPEGTFVVAGIGRFDPQKNHSLLVEAFARLSRQVDARLLLAGSGCSQENRELIAMLDNARVRQHARLLGARSDVAALLSAIDVLTIASSFGEALPMVAIEVAAAGLPIVATDVGDGSRFAQENGAVVPADEPDAMAMALARVYGHHLDTNRAAGLDNSRKKLLEPYSLVPMSGAYLDLYRDMIG